MRRFTALLLVLLLLTMTLAGCAQKKAGSGSISGVATGPDVAERRIRELVLFSRPQSSAPDEFEFTKLLAEGMKQLGLSVKIEIMPWDKMSDLVWFQRDKWDFTGWQMVGRPERSDPDEMIYNLFHSSTAEKGYNFVGWVNPDYDKIAEEQRSETDPAKRAVLVKKAQSILAADPPYVWIVHPKVVHAFNQKIWDPSTVVEAKGIGIKNFWTFVKATPLTDKKDMVLNTEDNVKAINPLYVSGAVDSWITELIWDRLMRIDANGLPQPFAAEKVEWKDSTTVLVTLRQGMKWHDGQPVTVDDVVFSFQAPMGKMAPMYKPFVSNIASVDKVGKDQVQFKLIKPSAAFLITSLAKVNLIPKHIWDPVLKDLESKGINAEKYQEKTPIGSGPFRFVQWKQGEEVVLQANSSHFLPPKMNRWILRVTSNQEAALGMLQSGELNFLSAYNGDPALLADKVKSNPNLKMVAAIDMGSRFVGLNNRRPPFNNKAFRQALQYAVNRQAIVDMIYKGYAVPSHAIISPAFDFWYNGDLDKMYPYNPEKAKEILKQAGYEWDAQGRLLYPKGQKETLGGN